ncbi:MAG TPA: alpha/beta fold hydrolase [Candidatus Didemnitutus sp.]|jgi:homoserine O-acetyltransferase
MSHRPKVSAPQVFDLPLPDLALERGGLVRRHRLHGWWWGPVGDGPGRLTPGVPTVLLIHALTGGAQAGGRGGWWEPLIGAGRALDPAHYRILCFNNLGSFYGSSAPGMPGFPRGPRVTLTSGDIARSLLLGLDRLGIPQIHLAAGGSLGGMVALALGALAPRRIERLLPIAACAASSAWVVGWNHVGREILRLDPGYPHHVNRGLELARQLAMLTYRAEPGLDTTQHRSLPSIRRFKGYRVQSYLEHHGRKLKNRFTARCYELLLDAMDHHDLFRPLPGTSGPALARIRASTLVVHVATDQLFTPAQSDLLVKSLRSHGAPVARVILRSPHGHDAFLIEWPQLAAILTRALRLPAPRS